MIEQKFFEEMLATYPPEKRELARQVYHRFADGDSSNFFTQLFIVLDVYAHYAERIPQTVVEANQNALETIRDMREEIGLLAKTIETRDVTISNHAEKTNELCKITIAKCNETVSKIELMLKNLGSQVDAKAIVQGIKTAVENGVAPLLKRTEEATQKIEPTLEKINAAADRAAQLWPQRIWKTALIAGAIVGGAVALAGGITAYLMLHDFYEREVANRLAYAQAAINYNKDAFTQLAMAQQPIKVLRTADNGVIQGYVLEVLAADGVETRVENGQTNAYVYFSSSVLEQEIQEIQNLTTQLQKANQQFDRTNSSK